jgi:hypothetical protein
MLHADLVGRAVFESYVVWPILRVTQALVATKPTKPVSIFGKKNLDRRTNFGTL